MVSEVEELRRLLSASETTAQQVAEVEKCAEAAEVALASARRETAWLELRLRVAEDELVASRSQLEEAVAAK